MTTRSTIVACGVWVTSKKLVVAVVEPLGFVSAELFVPRRDDARHALLRTVGGIAGAELVFCGAQSDPIVSLARERRVPFWLVHAGFVDGFCRAAGFRRPTPRRLAALLARLPSTPYPWVLAGIHRHAPAP